MNTLTTLPIYPTTGGRGTSEQKGDPNEPAQKRPDEAQRALHCVVSTKSVLQPAHPVGGQVGTV